MDEFWPKFFSEEEVVVIIKILVGNSLHRNGKSKILIYLCLTPFIIIPSQFISELSV